MVGQDEGLRDRPTGKRLDVPTALDKLLEPMQQLIVSSSMPPQSSDEDISEGHEDEAEEEANEKDRAFVVDDDEVRVTVQ